MDKETIMSDTTRVTWGKNGRGREESGPAACFYFKNVTSLTRCQETISLLNKTDKKLKKKKLSINFREAMVGFHHHRESNAQGFLPLDIQKEGDFKDQNRVPGLGPEEVSSVFMSGSANISTRQNFVICIPQHLN